MARKQTPQNKPAPSFAAVAASSVMEQLRNLDHQRQALMEGARAEALKAAEMAIGALNSLGFHFKIVEEKSRKVRSSAAGRRKGTRTVKAVDCPICGYMTQPPHDRRAHRAQTQKKPFTAQELEAKGLKKI